MRRINKLLVYVTALLAFLLILAIFVPHISSAKLPIFAFLGVITPIIILFNIVLLVYWVLVKKWVLIVPFLALLCSYFFLGSMLGLSFWSSEKKGIRPKKIKLMSFNAQGFDRWNSNDEKKEIGNSIVKFVESTSPDIVCFQEFFYRYLDDFEDYPYRYMNYDENVPKVTLTTFSKYPIINSKSLGFPDSTNEGFYSDIVVDSDTIRIYNIHLESAKIVPEEVSEKPSTKLFERLSKTFAKQHEQAVLVYEHRSKSSYKHIVCGDFNNNQFSNAYTIIRGDDMQDSFLEKGSGFGVTHSFLGFPQRIDFILSDENFEVLAHKNFNKKISDHEPIMATLSLKPKN